MMASKNRKLTQKTIQETQATASQLAPGAANANTKVTPEESSADSAAADTATEKQMDKSAISVQTLQTELRLFRETLSADIKMQIEAMQEELRGDIATLQRKAQEDIKTLRDELSAQMKTLADNQSESINTQKEMERSLTDVCDRVVTLEKSNENLSREYKKVLEKCMDLENRSRRSNIRIIGVEENSEMGNPTRFVTDLLVQILGRENFCTPLIIDRAHRTLGPKPKPGERPRALLARLHYYTDKEKILRLSREKGQLLYNGHPVHIFPDMSPEVSRLRSSFKQVKTKLRAAGIQYSLYYPAKLNITVKGSRHVFTDPKQAEEFIASNTSEDAET